MDSKVNLDMMRRGDSADFVDQPVMDSYRCENSVLQDLRPVAPVLPHGSLNPYESVAHYKSLRFLKRYEKLISSFQIAVERGLLFGVRSHCLKNFLQLAQHEEEIDDFNLLNTFLVGLSKSLGVACAEASHGKDVNNRDGMANSFLGCVDMRHVASGSDKKVVVWDNHVDVVACILIIFLRLKGFEVCVVPDGVFLQQRYVLFLQQYCGVEFFRADGSTGSFEGILFEGRWNDKLSQLIASGKYFICEFCGDGPVVCSLMGGQVPLDRICYVAQQTNATLTQSLRAKMKNNGTPFYDFNNGYIKEKELCGTAKNIIRAVEERSPDLSPVSPWSNEDLSTVVVWGGVGRLGRRIVLELEEKNKLRHIPFSIIVIDPSIASESMLLSVNSSVYSSVFQVRVKDNGNLSLKLMHVVTVATGCLVDEEAIVKANSIFHNHTDKPLFVVGTHDYDADRIPDCVNPFNRGYMANFILDRPTGLDYLDMVYSRHAACLVKGLSLLGES